MRIFQLIVHRIGTALTDNDLHIAACRLVHQTGDGLYHPHIRDHAAPRRFHGHDIGVDQNLVPGVDQPVQAACQIHGPARHLFDLRVGYFTIEGHWIGQRRIVRTRDSDLGSGHCADCSKGRFRRELAFEHRRAEGIPHVHCYQHRDEGKKQYQDS